MKRLRLTTLSGQIVVLFAVILIALLGFTALAVDGAVVYSDKRGAQNGADSAALAGAGMAAEYWENHQILYDNFACNNTDVINGMNLGVTRAIERAATNNYTIENNLSNQNGVQIDCHVSDIGPYFDQYIDVTVMITSTSTTSFAQLFYSGPLTSTVISKVRVHPRTNLGFGYAIASIGPNCSTGGVTGNGNIEITTDHGGIFSNSCMNYYGHVQVDVNDPLGNGIRYVTTLTEHGGAGSVEPPPVQSPVSIEPYKLEEPKCSELSWMGNVDLQASDTRTIGPGNYGTIRLSGSSELTMNPGLYCLNGNMTLNGSQILRGTGVTIYFINGGFSAAGNSDVQLTAPLSDIPPSIKGLLMYAKPGNESTFTLTGTNGTSFTGTIYVPDGTINAVGTPGLGGLQCQLVSEQVTFSGTAVISLDFSGALNFQVPATLDLTK